MGRKKRKSTTIRNRKPFSVARIFWKMRKDKFNLAHIPSHEERRLTTIKREKHADIENGIKVSPIDEAHENFNLEDLKRDHLDPGKRVEIIGQLLARNVHLRITQKINATNAFEIELVDVKDLG
jgi:hypothetical protein